MASRKDEKNEGTARSDTNNPQGLQQQQESVIRSIDETKDNIRAAVEEARQEIPKYNQVVKEYQNDTIDASRQIAESYLDSQKQVINSMQSVWNQNMNQMQSWWGMQIISPRMTADMYTRMASSFADATIAMARIGNNMMFANMEAAKTSMNYARDNAKELARVTTNFTGTFEQASREATSRSNEEGERHRQR
ncbi:MAG: hypothetical protein ACREAY_08875 [Nitrososphaera sp.]|uniref:hypothetical protein n=1 Tax=Nitrososphaera sp. TaxID=1971748 RepID=UPI003D6F8A11